MSNEYVKNLKGSTTPACKCSSFLCHWENYSGTSATICSRLRCSETKNLGGAHVIKCHGNAYSTQYIVPLCPICNNPNNTDCFYLKSNVELAPVANRERCKPC